MKLPEYKGPFAVGHLDTAWWRLIEPRAGDIIVATPPKCGTTWTQALCLLLVHDGPAPQPLHAISPWVDFFDTHASPEEVMANRQEMAARANAQPFRRVMKTHAPLHGLKYRSDAFYVVCGRDPRDAALSMLDHIENIADSNTGTAKTPNEIFASGIVDGPKPFPIFRRVFDLIASFWASRALPNILFLHYEDMSGDLEAEIAHLASFLGLEKTPSELRELLRFAQFDFMRENATQMTPGSSTWKNHADFFRKGRRGEWRHVLSAENQARYLRETRARFDSTMLDWLERGRGAVGDPRTL